MRDLDGQYGLFSFTGIDFKIRKVIAPELWTYGASLYVLTSAIIVLMDGRMTAHRRMWELP